MLTHRPPPVRVRWSSAAARVLTLCLVAASLFGASAPRSAAATLPSTCPQLPAAALARAGTDATCVTPTFDYFTATPSPVAYGGTVTLSWSASSPNPLTCTVSSSVGGTTGGASGTWTTGPLTSQTYFELHCWDAYGAGNTTGITVSVSGSGGGPSSYAPVGWLDSVGSGGAVGGWSCDGDSYATPIYVQIYADGALAAQVQASAARPDVAAAGACDGTGNHGFTYQLPSYLLNGQAHTVEAVGVNVDAAGGVVGSGDAELSGSPKTVTLGSPLGGDRIPPTVTITAPAGGAVVTGAVQIAVSAGDNVAVAGVQVQLDGADLGSELTTAPYAETWDPTHVPNGYHTLTAVARDAAGNRSTASATVLVSDSATDGAGDEETSGSLSITPQRSLLNTGWCSAPGQAWGVATAPHVQYRNLLTSLLYWKASVSLDICIDTKRHVVIGFTSEKVTPLYTLPVVWHYDNAPVWSVGPTGSKATFSTVQVTDSFTGCPFGIPIGCNKVSFTVVFNIAGTGIYSYTVKFH